MTNSNDTKANTFSKFYAISIAWQLGFLIVVPIAGFLFIGHVLDEFFRISPLFLLLGLVIGLIITVYEVYQMFLPLIHTKKP